MLIRPIKTYQRKATSQPVVSLPIFRAPLIIDPNTSSDFDNSQKHGNVSLETTFDRLAKDVKLPPPPPPPGPDESIYNASSSFENYSDVSELEEIPIINPNTKKPSRAQKRKKFDDDEDDIPLLMRKKSLSKVKKQVKNAKKIKSNIHHERIIKRRKMDVLEYEKEENMEQQSIGEEKIPSPLDQIKYCTIELTRLSDGDYSNKTEDINSSEIQDYSNGKVQIDSKLSLGDPPDIEMEVDSKEIDKTDESLSETENILQNLSIDSSPVLLDRTNSHSQISNNLLKRCSVELVQLSLNNESHNKESAISSSNGKIEIEKLIPKLDEIVPNLKMNHVNTYNRGKPSKKNCDVALTRLDAIEKFPDKKNNVHKKGRRYAQQSRNELSFFSSTPFNRRSFPSRLKLSPINNNFIVFDTTTKTINSTNSIEVVDPTQLGSTSSTPINEKPTGKLIPVLYRLENSMPIDHRNSEQVTEKLTENSNRMKTDEMKKSLFPIKNSNVTIDISETLNSTVVIEPTAENNTNVNFTTMDDTADLDETEIVGENEIGKIKKRLSISADENQSRSLFDDTVPATSPISSREVSRKYPSKSKSRSLESSKSMEALTLDDPDFEEQNNDLIKESPGKEESRSEELEKPNKGEEKHIQNGKNSGSESEVEESLVENDHNPLVLKNSKNSSNLQYSLKTKDKSLLMMESRVFLVKNISLSENGSLRQFPSKNKINHTNSMETDEDITSEILENGSISIPSQREIDHSESDIFADSVEINGESMKNIEKDSLILDSFLEKSDKTAQLDDSTTMKNKITSEPFILLKRLYDPVRISSKRGNYLRSQKFHLSAISESINKTESMNKANTETLKGKIDVINENQQIIEKVNNSVPEFKLPNGKTDVDTKFVFLKPGKQWARSLSILNHIQNDQDIEKMSIGKGKNWRKSVMNVLNMQETGIIDLFDSVHNGIDENPNLTMNFQGRKTSILSRRKTSIHDPCYRNMKSNIIIPESTEEARNVVLKRCGQNDCLKFSDCYPNSYLKHCRKIGEGVYGEVFLYKNKNESSVIKIIPIEGSELVNGEPQKKFSEILSEIIIAEELHNLRFHEANMTNGFVEVKKIKCLKGKYPKKLIDHWKNYDEEKNSENDCPIMFDDDQMYISLELGNGGQDLEAFIFQNATEAYSTFIQIALTLAVGEKSLNFEHRDMHWGNILISKTNDNIMKYKLDSNDYEYSCQGIKVSVIDFTLSRISYQGCCMYNDLALDPSLFTAVGEYQFDIYRLMRDKLKNDWKQYEPHTNILWLHYTLDKMITAVRYKKTNTKIHKKAIENLQELKDKILEYESAFDFITNCESVTGLTHKSVETH